MNLSNFLFTSESVSEGHPDKVCDRISDAIVDMFLGREPEARAKSFGQLMRNGIATNTGLLKGRDAAIQMMILPTLIVIWAMTVLVIAIALGTALMRRKVRSEA